MAISNHCLPIDLIFFSFVRIFILNNSFWLKSFFVLSAINIMLPSFFCLVFPDKSVSTFYLDKSSSLMICCFFSIENSVIYAFSYLFLRYNWHTELCKLKVTTCQFVTFVYCNIITPVALSNIFIMSLNYHFIPMVKKIKVLVAL